MEKPIKKCDNIHFYLLSVLKVSWSFLDIINAVNNANISLVFDRPVDFVKYLGTVQRNATGHIVGKIINGTGSQDRVQI
jgi:hypothetical protein